MKPHHSHLKLRSGNFSIERHDYENMGLNERLTSMFLGGLLIGRNLKNPFKSKFLYGAYLTYRGITGNCLVYERLGINAKKPHAVNIRGEFVIDKPATELYSYWRNLNNLPISLQQLMHVDIIDEHLSTWKSNTIGKLFSIKWDAEIVKDEPGHLIGWRALNDKIFHHVGRVEFVPSADGTTTTLKIVLTYHPPMGGIGIGLAKLLNPLFEQALKKEIKHFKHKIEYPGLVLS